MNKKLVVISIVLLLLTATAVSAGVFDSITGHAIKFDWTMFKKSIAKLKFWNRATSVCGNGIQEGKEQCDRTDFGLIKNCAMASQAFTGGILDCKTNCVIDIRGCTQQSNGEGTGRAGGITPDSGTGDTGRDSTTDTETNTGRTGGVTPDSGTGDTGRTGSKVPDSGTGDTGRDSTTDTETNTGRTGGVTPDSGTGGTGR